MNETQTWQVWAGGVILFLSLWGLLSLVHCVGSMLKAHRRGVK